MCTCAAVSFCANKCEFCIFHTKNSAREVPTSRTAAAALSRKKWKRRGSPEGAEVQTCTLFSPLWALFGTFLSQQKVTSSPPQRRREQRIKSRLVLKSNMGEMLRKAHQSHSKFPRNTAWQRVQRRLSQTQVNILSGFANAASSSASGYSKHNRS